jgi:hypothetical protein
VRITKALLIAAVASFVCGLGVAEAGEPKVVVARARIKLKIARKALKRSEIFNQLHGITSMPEDGVKGPRAPQSGPVAQVDTMIEMSGPVSEGIDLDVELTYASSNRTQEAWVEGQGWVDQPKTKEVRPDVEWTDDGKYKITINTFNKGWFGAKYYLKSAKFTVYNGDAKPDTFEIRGDTGEHAVGVEQTLKVLVKTIQTGRTDKDVKVEVQTYAGAAANNILGLPMGNGQFWLEIPIELAQR